MRGEMMPPRIRNHDRGIQMTTYRRSQLPSAATFNRAVAIVLPALLGQGLIYLCIMDRIDIVTAVGAILFIGVTALTAASMCQSESNLRLVRRNAPPPMHRGRAAAAR
jgi:hypothetical protein